MIVPNDDAFARILAANDITRNGLSHNPSIRKSKIFGDDAAPAIGPKFNRSHKQPWKVYARR
jgi:hypothetical protein